MSESECTEAIDLCRQGIAVGLNKTHEEYARQLMSWLYNRRGEVRASGGDDKQALADFEAAIEANPNSWHAIHNRGVSYAMQGRVPDALAAFDRTIELNRGYANAYFNRAELLYQQRNYEAAIRDYTAAIKLSPEDAGMYNSRGHALYRVERFGEALGDYGEALRLDPKNAAVLINRGDVFTDLGRYSEAARDYQTAIAINPQQARGFKAAAWLMATCPDEHYRNEKLAIEAAKRAIELDGGGDYRDLETLAAAQASSGLFEEAKKTQEQAIAKAPRRDSGRREADVALRPRAGLSRTPADRVRGAEEADSQVRQASGTSPEQKKPGGLFRNRFMGGGNQRR